MDQIAVQVENISKTFTIQKPRGISGLLMKSNPNKYRTFLALDGVSFTVKKGEVLGIIGLNGSGKTTLLRIIAGVYKPTMGQVQVNGRLSPLLQLATGFEKELSAKENIIMNGLLLGVSKSFIQSKIEEIIQYAELEKFSEMKLKHYSSGMRARLGFSIAMQVNPEILLVDEIMSVGDKDFRKKSFETFLSLKKENKTILHATHNIEVLRDFTDKVLLLHKGKMIMLDEPNEVIKKYNSIKPTK